MKIGIVYESGIGETLHMEVESSRLLAGDESGEIIKDAQAVLNFFDARRWQRNQEIANIREFINSIPDPAAKIMFTQFMDQFVGVSSQAKPISVGLDSGELAKDFVKNISVPKGGGGGGRK